MSSVEEVPGGYADAATVTPASEASPQPRPAGAPDSDRTARARIRDAAIARFAADGVAPTSIRAIAEHAGVSPPLVIHHFGTKDALRVACDEHVAALVREQKHAAMAGGAGLDPIAALRAYDDGPPMLAYLARTLIDGSPHVADLVDELVADAVEYMAEGESAGVLTPSADPRGRAVVLTLWSLGALVLREHVERLLGVDPAAAPAEAAAYFLPALDILGRGIMTPQAHERISDGFRGPGRDSEDEP